MTQAETERPFVIRVEHLTKSYGKTTAVQDLSFSIRKGEIVGFLGPNGAGKTTTMRILSCFIPPTSGTVTVAGMDVVRDSLEIRKRVGYMPENVPLYPEMRVSEYLNFRAALRGLSGERQWQRVRAVMEECGLKDVARFVIGRLSKGYRQRVGLADALVHEPDLLLLDEPTLGLDPSQIRQVRSLLKGLEEHHTVLLSTHILSEVEMLCTRVLIINKGRIVASDTPERLMRLLKGEVRFSAEIKAPLDPVLRHCREMHGVLEATGELDGEWVKVSIECEKDVDIRADLFGMVSRNGWTLRELKASDDRRLEDVFMALTGEVEQQ